VDVLLWLIPAALLLGLLGLAAFLWALKSGQFDDLDGAAHRILFDDEAPLPPEKTPEPPPDRPERRPGPPDRRP
jgi:cbb3-type cytochrome oxidase maturation protein